MKVFTHYKDVPENCKGFFSTLLEDPEELTDSGITLMFLFGGDFHVLEDDEDVAHLLRNQEVAYCDGYEDVEGGSIFYWINNNSGGPSYFIPEELINKWHALRELRDAFK